MIDLPGYTTVDIATVDYLRGLGARARVHCRARLRSVTAVELAEAILGVMLIVVVSLLVPGQWGFLGWEPHPLWIVVLAIAIRYAVPAGYVASGLAAGSELLLLSLRSKTGFHAVAGHDLVEPFLFLVVGVLTSRAVQNRRKQLMDAEERIADADQKLRAVTARHVALRTTNQELEKQIVGQSTSITALYEIAKQLQTLRVRDLYAGALNLVMRFLECQACALYLAEQGQLRLRAGLPVSTFRRQETIASDAGLVGQAIRERRVITIRDRLLDADTAFPHDETVLMAGPLVNATGEVIGVIVIEQIPFLKFSPASVRLFTILLDWTSAALSNGMLYERTCARLVMDERTGTYTAQQMVRLIDEQLRLRRRYQHPVSMIVMQATGTHALSPDTHTPFLGKLLAIARRSLRVVDVIGHHPDPDKIILILPMIDTDAARIMVARIIDAVSADARSTDGDDRPLTLRYALVALADGMETTHDALAEASAQLHPAIAKRHGEEPDGACTVPLPTPLRAHEVVNTAEGAA